MKNNKYWEFKNLVAEQPNNEAEEIELSISGEIVNIPCWDGDVSANVFKAELDKFPNAKTITVGINSPGGDVFEAIAIANYLRNHPAKVIAKIYAMCASAVTIIANSCDEVVIYDNAIFMIHDPMTVGAGGISAFKKIVNTLETIKESIIKTYKNYSHLSEEEISNLMTEETWMSAEKALEYGFVTEILTSKVEADKVEEIQNFMQGQVFKNFKKFPTGMFKNLFSSKQLEPKIQNKTEGEVKTMDLKELQEKHPDIYNQAVNQATQSVQNAERERIKNIINLGKKVTGADEIIQNAIDLGKTAEQVAFEIMNNSSIQTTLKAQQTLENLKKDTEESKVPQVESETPGEKNPEEVSVINAAVASFKNSK